MKSCPRGNNQKRGCQHFGRKTQKRNGAHLPTLCDEIFIYCFQASKQFCLFVVIFAAKGLIMDKRINILQGIHPGKFIKRDIRGKQLSQRTLAEAAHIPYQTINAIIQGKRNLTTEQALKIERILCLSLIHI